VGEGRLALFRLPLLPTGQGGYKGVYIMIVSKHLWGVKHGGE
jgi:hypothetical protein